VFDASLVPDLDITPDDIFIYPAGPIAGEEAGIAVAVRNKSQTSVTDVDVEVYLWDAGGNVRLLKSEKIPYMTPAEEKWITLSFDTTGRTGTNRIIAVIDPENRVPESSEDNNEATRDFHVADQAGLFMTATLDSDLYQCEEDVEVLINVRNTGAGKDFTLDVRVEDQDGYLVTLLNNSLDYISYASERNYRFAWNTGSTFAGLYRIHILLKEGVEIRSESIIPFTILPDLGIDTAIVTDRAAYGSTENVIISLSVKNQGKNYTLPEVKVSARILDSGSRERFNEVKAARNLLPGSTVSLGWVWNTGLSTPGDYTVFAEASLDGQVISTKSVSFGIEPSFILTGSLAVTPSVVFLGNTVRADYSIRNGGNADVNGALVRLAVIDPETQAVLNTHEETLDLGMNSARNGTFSISTHSYLLKTYTVLFQSVYQGMTKTIGITSFTVRDGTAPVVSILSPASGSQFKTEFDMFVQALDQASGVDRVEYRIDGGVWRFLPVSDPASGRYGLTWIPAPADDGPHAISFRAIDRAGNISAVVSTFITIDVTPPQAPAILSPFHNTVTASEVVDIRGTGEPGCSVEMASGETYRTTMAAANGEYTFEAVKLVPGQNSFSLRASDAIGNVSVATAYVLYLRIIPVPTITTDRSGYYPNKTAAVTSSIRNPSQNHAFQNLTARTSVTNSQGTPLFTEDRPLQTIPAGQTAELQATWNTSVHPIGTYTAKIEVLEGEVLLSEASTLFEIRDPCEAVRGVITAQPNPVSQGDDVTFAYSLTNAGNDPIAELRVEVLVVNPDTQEVENAQEGIVGLAGNQTATGSFILTTSDLPPGSYGVLLQVSSVISSEPWTLADTAFEVNSVGTWAKTYGGAGYDMAFSVKPTIDGGYIAAGESWSFRPFFSDAWVVKLDPNGGIQWQKSYGSSLHDVIYAIDETEDGGYIMAGETKAILPFLGLFWVTKVNGNGDVEWQKTYGQGWAHSIQQTSEGGYVAAGRNAGGAWIAKLKPNGDIQWQKSYRGIAGDWAHSVQQTMDDGYVVAGMMNGEAWVLKLNSNGQTQWQKTYENGCLDANFSIRQTGEGGYIMASASLTFGAGLTDLWIVKLDPNGGIEWQKTYGGPGFDLAHSVQQTRDGGYITAGWTGSFGTGNTDMWLLKLDGTGGIEWQKTYGGTGFDLAYSIQETPDGGYVVGGWTDSYGAGGGDVWVLKLDAGGNLSGCQEGLIGTTQIVPYNTSATAGHCSKTGQNTYVSPKNAAASVTTTTIASGEVCTD
jgi:hypothetical protein